jgi:hypothetical protein
MPALSVPKTPSIGFAIASESEHDCRVIATAFLFVGVLCHCFKSRRRLEAEILVLRHQLSALQQRAGRPHIRFGGTSLECNGAPPASRFGRCCLPENGSAPIASAPPSDGVYVRFSQLVRKSLAANFLVNHRKSTRYFKGIFWDDIPEACKKTIPRSRRPISIWRELWPKAFWAEPSPARPACGARPCRRVVC